MTYLTLIFLTKVKISKCHHVWLGLIVLACFCSNVWIFECLLHGEPDSNLIVLPVWRDWRGGIWYAMVYLNLGQVVMSRQTVNSTLNFAISAAEKNKCFTKLSFLLIFSHSSLAAAILVADVLPWSLGKLLDKKNYSKNI